jgi:hypothetical protein
VLLLKCSPISMMDESTALILHQTNQLFLRVEGVPAIIQVEWFEFCKIRGLGVPECDRVSNRTRRKSSHAASRMLIAVLVVLIVACNRSAGGATPDTTIGPPATLDPYVVARQTHDAARTVTATEWFQMTVEAELTRLAEVEKTLTATLSTATATLAPKEPLVPTPDPETFDSDDDMLSDAHEAELGTDPDQADSDGDGLSDGAEVLVWWSDPLVPDSDGDGLSDGDEVNLHGTDPLNRDTDGDGVLDGDAPDSTPADSPDAVCAGSPPARLAVDEEAIVVGETAIPLRPDPGTDGTVIDNLAPGTTVLVVGGPRCDADADLRWWQVDYGGQVGWTPEGGDDTYYLAPME